MGKINYELNLPMFNKGIKYLTEEYLKFLKYSFTIERKSLSGL